MPVSQVPCHLGKRGELGWDDFCASQKDQVGHPVQDRLTAASDVETKGPAVAVLGFYPPIASMLIFLRLILGAAHQKSGPPPDKPKGLFVIVRANENLVLGERGCGKIFAVLVWLIAAVRQPDVEPVVKTLLQAMGACKRLCLRLDGRIPIQKTAG